MPANATKDGETEAIYFEALGSFISMYSLAELSLYQAIKHHSGLTDAQSRKKLGGAGVAQNIRTLRTLLRGKPVPNEAPALLAAIAHLSVVNQHRNTIVHYGTRIDDDGIRRATKQLRAADPVKVKRQRVSARLLSWMEIDVTNISLALMLYPATQRISPMDRAGGKRAAAELARGWQFGAATRKRLAAADAGP